MAELVAALVGPQSSPVVAVGDKHAGVARQPGFERKAGLIAQEPGDMRALRHRGGARQ